MFTSRVEVLDASPCSRTWASERNLPHRRGTCRRGTWRSRGPSYIRTWQKQNRQQGLGEQHQQQNDGSTGRRGAGKDGCSGGRRSRGIGAGDGGPKGDAAALPWRCGLVAAGCWGADGWRRPGGRAAGGAMSTSALAMRGARAALVDGERRWRRSVPRAPGEVAAGFAGGAAARRPPWPGGS